MVFIFINKAEYIALGYAAKETIWIKHFINKFKFNTVVSLTFPSYNKINIVLIKNMES